MLRHRGQVWDLIRTVAADPDPTPEHEERFGGTNMDPLTLALNTTRPRAIFAAAAYGVWLQRLLQPSRVGGDSVPDDTLFEQAPELAQLLEEHLDPAADPSVAVRAAIANFYANFFVLDPAWTQEQTAAIFPDGDSPLREAAWGAYVLYTPPYDNLLSSLREVYERSAELAGEPSHDFRWDTPPEAKLGEHLAIFYWRVAPFHAEVVLERLLPDGVVVRRGVHPVCCSWASLLGELALSQTSSRLLPLPYGAGQRF